MHDELLVFCENLKKLRKESLLTQKEMAKICGISINTIRKIEKGQYPPRLTVEPIIKVSRHFNIPPSRLFTPHPNRILAKGENVLYNK